MEIKESFKNLNLYLEELNNNLYLLDNKILKKECQDKIQDISKRIESPKIKIGFWSFFSAGKSTLINNLIGTDILPTNAKSSTSVATTIEYGDTNSVAIILKDRKKFKNIILSDLKELSSYNNSNTKFSLKLSQNLNKNDFYDEKYSEFIKKFKDNNRSFNDAVKKEFSSEEQYIFPREYQIKIGSYLSNYTIKKIDQIKFLINIFTNNLSVDDIKSINECDFKYGNEISEIIIKTNNWEFNKDIKILDLPGFGSFNDRHTNVTKEKLKDMNAFVIVEGDTLTEGECKNEMFNLKKSFPEIFKNSYFIKNKVSLIKEDTAINSEQKMNAFHELANIMGFKKENIFEIDALEETNGKKCEYYKNFIEFKKKLKNDSVELITKEFLSNSLNNLKNIENYIINEVDKNIKNIGLPEKNDNYTKGITLKAEINKKVENFKSELEKSLTKLSKLENSTEITNKIENELKLEKELKKIIAENKDKIIANSKSKKDIHSLDCNNLSNSIFKFITPNELIRKKCQKSAEEVFSEKFYKAINDNFNDELLKYIPCKQSDLLKETINKNINERLNGAIDVILFDYSKDIDKIITKSKIAYNFLINDDDDEDSLKAFEDNKEHFKGIDEDNYTKKDIFKKYNIEIKNISENKEFIILSNIISKEISEYLEDDIIPEINKYILAIVNNYIKDVIIKTKDILNIDNFLAEFQQNIEDDINDKIEELITAKKEKIENLKNIKCIIEEKRKNIQ